MKIICIGDIHGRTIWKQIVEKEADADKIIFLGDYFDSFDISGDIQLQNFNNILQFKDVNPEKVVLLYGNHEQHYILYGSRMTDERYSGFNSVYALQFKEVLHSAIQNDLVQLCYRNGELCCTHAGLTNTWLKNTGFSRENLEEFLNDLLKYKPRSFCFLGSNPYGDSIESGPLWVRPRSLVKDPPSEKLVQVVGHTGMYDIDFIVSRNKLKYAFIDCLGSSKYLELELIDGKVVKFKECTI